MKSWWKIEECVAGHFRVRGSAADPPPPCTDFCFHDSLEVDPRGWREGGRVKGGEEGSGEGEQGMNGSPEREDQTHCNCEKNKKRKKKKRSTPSSAHRALLPRPPCFSAPPSLSAPLGGSDLHRRDLVHLCPHHLDAVQDLLLMAR